LTDESVHFDGQANVHEPQFNFDCGRIYDFVRKAKAKIGEAMTDHLSGILPGIGQNTREDLRTTFERLFAYHAYKHYPLTLQGQSRGESMKLFVFNPPDNYVAHVCFNCTTMKGAGDKYTVSTAMTCHKYTTFECQDTGIEAILIAIQNLHVADNE
jgi:hypothetical protein